MEGVSVLRCSSEIVKDQLPADLRGLACQAWKVGSRETCVPVPDASDDDILVKCDSLRAFVYAARQCGFESESDDEYPTCPDMYGVDEFSGRFHSLRMGTLNVIATEDDEFISRFLNATSVAKRLNLQTRSERIVLFEAIMYGKYE